MYLAVIFAVNSLCFTVVSGDGRAKIPQISIGGHGAQKSAQLHDGIITCPVTRFKVFEFVRHACHRCHTGMHDAGFLQSVADTDS